MRIFANPVEITKDLAQCSFGTRFFDLAKCRENARFLFVQLCVRLRKFSNCTTRINKQADQKLRLAEKRMAAGGVWEGPGRAGLKTSENFEH